MEPILSLCLPCMNYSPIPTPRWLPPPSLPLMHQALYHFSPSNPIINTLICFYQAPCNEI